MSKLYLYAVFLSATLSTFYASPTYAAIVVYTDRTAWETDMLSVPFDYLHLHDQDFEGISTGSLLTGKNYDNFFFPLNVIITGAPGFNAIDDSSTADPFSNTLSPNGSTYYLGDVSTGASVEPALSFPELESLVIGFGADWVIQGDLIMEIQGTSIPFSTYLTTGSGFLGIITDRPVSPLVANLSGLAVFGMDNIRTVSTPVPAAIWLFGSGLLALVSMVKRPKFSIKYSAINR